MSVSGATTRKQNTRTTRPNRTREIIEENSEDAGATGTTEEGKGPAGEDEALFPKEQVPDKDPTKPDESSERSSVRSKHSAPSRRSHVSKNTRGVQLALVHPNEVWLKLRKPPCELRSS